MGVYEHVSVMDAADLCQVGRQTVMSVLSTGNAIEALAKEAGIDIDLMVEGVRNTVWTATVFQMGVLSATPGEFWAGVQSGRYLKRLQEIAEEGV